MPTDLSTSGFFHRNSVLLGDHELVVLEHQTTRDRVRRFAYDRIESIVSWRTTPWGHVLLFFLLLGLPGIVLVTVQFPIARIIGWGLLTVTVLLEARYLYMRKTFIRITRAGDDYLIQGIASPRKVRRLLPRLDAAIRHAQEQDRAAVVDPSLHPTATPHRAAPTQPT